MAGTVETKHFQTLTEAERWIDEQIEQEFEGTGHEGAWGPFNLDHDTDLKCFHLVLIKNRTLHGREATYDHDDT